MVQVLSDAEIQRIREEVRKELERKQVIQQQVQSQPVQEELHEVGPREVLAENNKRHVYVKDAVLDEQTSVYGIYMVLDVDVGTLSYLFQASSDVMAVRQAKIFKQQNPDMATEPEKFVLYKVGYGYNRFKDDEPIIEAILRNKEDGGRTRAPMRIAGFNEF